MSPLFEDLRDQRFDISVGFRGPLVEARRRSGSPFGGHHLVRGNATRAGKKTSNRRDVEASADMRDQIAVRVREAKRNRTCFSCVVLSATCAEADITWEFGTAASGFVARLRVGALRTPEPPWPQTWVGRRSLAGAVRHILVGPSYGVAMPSGRNGPGNGGASKVQNKYRKIWIRGGRRNLQSMCRRCVGGDASPQGLAAESDKNMPKQVPCLLLDRSWVHLVMAFLAVFRSNVARV